MAPGRTQADHGGVCVLKERGWVDEMSGRLGRVEFLRHAQCSRMETVGKGRCAGRSSSSSFGNRYVKTRQKCSGGTSVQSKHSIILFHPRLQVDGTRGGPKKKCCGPHTKKKAQSPQAGTVPHTGATAAPVRPSACSWPDVPTLENVPLVKVDTWPNGPKDDAPTGPLVEVQNAAG